MDLTNQSINIYLSDGSVVNIQGNIIEEEYAKLVREGKVDKIEIHLQ
ncbi:hypothetical protein PL321_06585 [Caloramator sp. mosi_1]|nr:hypothetical protein [Caloramator sp. mosi_1]WDC85149.1 hypothetical protein PL321_06585 [Caloramator sp. mosi_1]